MSIRCYSRPEDLRNEDYLTVEEWDDQVGGWYTIGEANNAFAAENIIKCHIENDDNLGKTYSVLVVRREVFTR